MGKKKEYTAEATIKFNVDKKPVKFKVQHNCPDVWGLNIENALECWLARTEEYTGDIFCEYVESKGFNCKLVK